MRGRRATLARLLALGCLGALPPAARRAGAQGGADLDIVAWRGQFPPGELAGFTDRTGIRVHVLEARSDHDFLGLMHATQGREFDLLFPSNTFALEWAEFGLLKPFREDRLPLAGILPALAAAARRDWGFGDGPLWVPHSWIGTLVFWREKKAPGDAGDGRPGYGALWDPDAGRSTLGAAFPLMLGAGLHLERAGTIDPGALWGSYQDLYRMRRAWDAILGWCLERKAALRRLCDPGAESDPPCAPGKAARIGLAPDTALRAHAARDPALRFAPAAEGALLTANGAVMPAGARNVDEAHEFLAHFLDPGVAAACAAANGLNPAPAEAAGLLPDPRRDAHDRAYGEGALDGAHVLPPEPGWFRRHRAGYAGRLAEALGAPATSVE